ncbi:MAG: nucleoside-diphosphate kinase [Phycisphaerales bacterium]
METTLIILKPDAVQRGLMGKIITRFEDKGLQIVGMKMMTISPELAATHYEAHQGKPFYKGLVGFMTSSPVVVLAIRGVGAIAIARSMMGATFGSKAAAGTIRGDFWRVEQLQPDSRVGQPGRQRSVSSGCSSAARSRTGTARSRWVYDLSGGKPEARPGPAVVVWRLQAQPFEWLGLCARCSCRGWPGCGG